MDRKAIEARIAELRGELAKVEGTPTEVYSRIVGYYRSVRNWNAGKRQEYGQRLVFRFPETAAMAPASGAGAAAAEPAPAARSREEDRAPAPASRPAAVSAPDGASLREGILMFTKEHCPNCPPVKNFVVGSGIKAVFIDVEKDEGFALARDHGVVATPTVLGIDAEGRESFRAFDVKGLRERLEGAGGAKAGAIAAAPRQAGTSAALLL